MTLTLMPPMVSVAVAVWLPTVTVAVLVIEPVGLLVKVALIVKATQLLLDKEGIVQPAPCIAALVQLKVEQIVPPAESEQVGLPLTARLVTAGSLKTALVNVSPVVLVMVTV